MQGFQVGSNNKKMAWEPRTASSRNGARPGAKAPRGSIAQTAPNPANAVPMNRGWVRLMDRNRDGSRLQNGVKIQMRDGAGPPTAANTTPDRPKKALAG